VHHTTIVTPDLRHRITYLFEFRNKKTTLKAGEYLAGKSLPFSLLGVIILEALWISNNRTFN
jgi:hypothetical protein